MAENSRIEWTDHTFNPWVGCAKVSPACDHCYAESWARRAGQLGLWQGERRRTSAANWQKPLKWERDYIPGARVFCASLADVFDNQVPAEWRDDLWSMIRATPNLDWQLLTKRPQNIAKMLPPDWGDGYPNVWLGTTVENQTEAHRRIPHLLAVPATVRFLSCEPLLDPLDLTRMFHSPLAFAQSMHWVICGGESGSGWRPMNLEWARSLRDQCKDAGVPFFMKQMGGLRKPFPPIPDDLMVREFPNA
jgi:protein gp37